MKYRDVPLASGCTIDEQSKSAILHLVGMPPSTLFAELMLLVSGQVEGLSLRTDTGQKVRVVIGEEASLSWSESGLDLIVSGREVEGWAYFFLRWHKNGVAEVDHIDVDLAPESEGKQRWVYFTLKFDDFAQSVSATEARRRLFGKRERK